MRPFTMTETEKLKKLLCLICHRSMDLAAALLCPLNALGLWLSALMIRVWWTQINLKRKFIPAQQFMLCSCRPGLLCSCGALRDDYCFSFPGASSQNQKWCLLEMATNPTALTQLFHTHQVSQQHSPAMSQSSTRSYHIPRYHEHTTHPTVR